MTRRAPRRSKAALVVALLILGGLVVLIQLDLITLAFRSLGLSRLGAAGLFLACAVGSLVNIPLFRMRRGAPGDLPDEVPTEEPMWPRLNAAHTLVAANLGGAIIPGAFAAYLWLNGEVGTRMPLLCVALVAAVSRAFSRVEPGVGVTMPVFVAPLSAATIALMLDPAHAAPLAYIGGTLGVLLGADVLRLHQTARFGAPVAAIGGGGTFDGIFLAGVVAVLLT